MHNWLQFSAYVGAELVGAVIGAYAYELVARPRRTQRPIREAARDEEA